MDQTKDRDDVLFEALGKSKKKKKRRVIRTIVIVPGSISSGSMTQAYAVPQWFTDGKEYSLGDVFVFAFDANNNLIGMSLVTHFDHPAPSPEPSQTPEMPGGGAQQGTGMQMPSGGAGGGFGGFSGATQETEKERYSTVGTTILSVTPQETVTVPITVDELDILSVHVGQDVLVTLDALPGQSFSGVIEEINTTASNEGGNSKYSAVVRLDRTESMLGGMNASAKIVVESRDAVLLIPSAALIEQDGQTMVYTAYDTKTQTLSDTVSVEIGLSDGERVQILSGLSEGDTVWYTYYDTLEVQGLTV